MDPNRRYLFRIALRIISVTATVPAMALLVSIPAHAGQCNPIDESSDEYSVEICFEAPLGDAEVVGDAEVSISVTVRGTDPGIRRVVFYLSDEYMLTDFSAPYSFTLPSEYWIDGEYLLEAEALLRDNTTTSRAGIRVEFANGVLSTPVNTGAFTPALGSDAGPGASFVVAATGDGPDGGPNAEAVVSRIERVGANMLLFLGDVYEKGSRTEFFNWYGSDGANWDALRPITNPTLGNHETSGGVAIGYDEYWDNVPRYYSFDAQGWHFVSLDSNALKRDDPDQVAWLQDDLSANTASCTIAFYHHPVLTVGPQGDSPELNDVWADLVDNGVDIVLGGHDHSYQRWTPLDRNLQPDDAGATQFVVGAGGHGIQIFSREDARMVTGADSSPNAYGALFLTLNIDGAEYSYVNIAGDVRDAGIIPCRGTGSDTLAPSVPANLTASSVSSAHIDLSWDASSDNVGVAGYTIYRDGSILDTVSIGVTSYTDSTPEPDTSYVYAVGALDASGNTSTRSTQAIITTLVTPSEVVAVASEDAYVSAENPSTNHGSQTFLRVDGSPTRRAYVRFDVSGVVSPVTSTVLRIYAESASTGGFEVRALTGAGWNESTLTLDNAPVPGSIVAASGPLAPNTYVEIDISGYVEGGGSIDFVLTPLSDSGLRLSSRESPHPPQLVMSHNTTATTSPDGKADEAAPRAIDDASGPAWRWILVAIVVIAAIPIVIRRSSRHREN